MTPSATAAELKSCPLYINGKAVISTGRKDIQHNPATGEAVAEIPRCTPEEISDAVEAAHKAFPAWSKTPVVQRCKVLFKFRDLMETNAQELVSLITEENGKTRDEAQGSFDRGIECIEFACGAPTLMMGDTVDRVGTSVDSWSTRHPVGVCVGITPFNFPMMVPLWMIPVALACGNTFVLKPSEKVPFSANRLGELLAESGLPEGVFNIVHGDRECVDALLEHPLVAAISFVGSTAVARHVYETGTRNGKRVQAAGGAKNHLIVMPDADLDQAAKAVQASAFGCAGERCMAGSLAVPVGGIAHRLVARIGELAGRMRVGPTDGGADVDMGPVISRAHLDRVAGYLDVAATEG